MAQSAKGAPQGASAVIPRLFCKDVEAEIEFCTKALGAVELLSRPGPDGKAAHAMLTIGGAMLMIDAEWPSLPSRAPVADGSSPVVIYIYVEDVDQTVERAVSLGATILRPVEDRFWGDRMGWIMAPSGHVWSVASRIEETTEAERQNRWATTLSEPASDSSDSSENS